MIKVGKTFILLIVISSCIPPFSSINPYVDGEKCNTINISNNVDLNFSVRTKQLSAVYIDFWFNTDSSNNLSIHPEGVEFKIDSNVSITRPAYQMGNHADFPLQVTSGTIYYSDCYFDRRFFRIGDTIIISLGGILLNDTSLILPPIKVAVDSIYNKSLTDAIHEIFNDWKN